MDHVRHLSSPNGWYISLLLEDPVDRVSGATLDDVKSFLQCGLGFQLSFDPCSNET